MDSCPNCRSKLLEAEISQDFKYGDSIYITCRSCGEIRMLPLSRIRVENLIFVRKGAV